MSLSRQYKAVLLFSMLQPPRITLKAMRSGTVRRLIYTASVFAASPLNDDGTGFKDSMDETCWTPLDLSFSCSNDLLTDYTHSKTLAEKEILSLGSGKTDGLEILTLPCGFVGGGIPISLAYTPSSVVFYISQLTNDASAYQTLRFSEEKSQLCILMMSETPISSVWRHLQSMVDSCAQAHMYQLQK